MVQWLVGSFFADIYVNINVSLMIQFYLKCVTFLYVSLIFGHNLVENAHK